jgi:hypothetical protein
LGAVVPTPALPLAGKMFCAVALQIVNTNNAAKIFEVNLFIMLFI